MKQKRRSPKQRSRRTQPQRLYALVVPGIEDLAAAELEAAGARPGETLRRFDRRDSILLFDADDPAPVLRCGLIEDVFAVLFDSPTPPSKSAPRMLARTLDADTLARAMRVHHVLRPRGGGRSYKAVVRVAGHHPFRREEVQSAFERAVGALLPHWVRSPQAASIEVWVHVVGERTIAGLRLSDDTLAGRRYKHAHLEASLKPPVARALVVLSGPRPGDVVVDPMAGAGTVVRERLDAGRARIAMGGDIDPAALAAARQNAGRRPALARWDATRLPLRSASVDAIITNPPYGRRHEAPGGVAALYRGAMKEAARVLRPGGRCVVLTGEPEALRAALPPALLVRSTRRLVVRGLTATAFVLARR
ncbi:MAG: methyltransferase domain-containing protein [Dehalococcoidia bacterium]